MALPIHKWTPEEYIAFERSSEHRHDYHDGDIYDMTGASREHNLINGNCHSSLIFQLKGRPCEAYASDMRVRADQNHYTYPDIVVVCGDPAFEDTQLDTLSNPTVIIEVLSPSTEHYDRTTKWKSYRGLESLQEYLLIAQDRPHIEHYIRQNANSWLQTEMIGLTGTVELPSIQCALAIVDIYDRIKF